MKYLIYCRKSTDTDDKQVQSLDSQENELTRLAEAQGLQFVRDLRSNVKRGNRAKLEHGGWPSRAPFGYVNDKATRTIQVCPKQAKYLVRAFEMYATGSYGLNEIADTLYAEGLRTKSGRKIYRNQIKRTLDSSFSAGLMPAGGKYYEGNHTPLISKALYDKVQDVMHNRSRPRPQKHFFPLRGFLSCETCGCALTASLKKGHQYYYCTNGKGQCEEHKSYLREQALYDTIAGILGNLKLSDRKIELMYNSAKERTGANTYTEQALATLQSHLESLKTKESKLLDTFLAEQITKELYDEKSREISNDKISTKKQIKELELKQPKFTLEPVKKIFKQASASQKDFLEGDETKKREVVEELLWNLSLKDKKVASIKYKSPFHLLSNVPKNADFSLLCTQ